MRYCEMKVIRGFREVSLSLVNPAGDESRAPDESLLGNMPILSVLRIGPTNDVCYVITTNLNNLEHFK